jgi:hypothetical protein
MGQEGSVNYSPITEAAADRAAKRIAAIASEMVKNGHIPGESTINDWAAIIKEEAAPPPVLGETEPELE